GALVAVLGRGLSVTGALVRLRLECRGGGLSLLGARRGAASAPRAVPFGPSGCPRGSRGERVFNSSNRFSRTHALMLLFFPVSHPPHPTRPTLPTPGCYGSREWGPP